MKFTKRYQVKWHDTDANRQVRPSQILMYMQETANEQLKSAGLSLDVLRDEKGLAFLLSSISIRVYKPLYTGDEIDVQTWVCEGRGLSYLRCFCIKRGEETVVEASSVWGLLDLKTNRLCKSEDAPYNLEPEPFLQLDLPRRLHVPHTEELTLMGERRIVYSDIDYNGHMNNTHYPDLFCDFTPDICQCRVAGMMLSFVHEAAYGHVLQVYHTQGADGAHLFRTIDQGGSVCTEAMLLTLPSDT